MVVVEGVGCNYYLIVVKHVICISYPCEDNFKLLLRVSTFNIYFLHIFFPSSKNTCSNLSSLLTEILISQFQDALCNFLSALINAFTNLLNKISSNCTVMKWNPLIIIMSLIFKKILLVTLIYIISWSYYVKELTACNCQIFPYVHLRGWIGGGSFLLKG